uniref:Uncharacterized protein n=1 Tax=Schlesneria paludicola TaxID=360056 RepID=A0A7C2P2C5_9PLAN
MFDRELFPFQEGLSVFRSAAGVYAVQPPVGATVVVSRRTPPTWYASPRVSMCQITVVSRRITATRHHVPAPALREQIQQPVVETADLDDGRIADVPAPLPQLFQKLVDGPAARGDLLPLHDLSRLLTDADRQLLAVLIGAEVQHLWVLLA